MPANNGFNPINYVDGTPGADPAHHTKTNPTDPNINALNLKKTEDAVDHLHGYEDIAALLASDAHLTKKTALIINYEGYAKSLRWDAVSTDDINGYKPVSIVGAGRWIMKKNSQHNSSAIPSTLNFPALSSVSGSLKRFTLIKQGTTGADNVMQSAEVDLIDKLLYTTHTSANKGTINQFYLDGVREQTSHRYSHIPNDYVGHQGLALQRKATGGKFLWTSVNYDAITDSEKYGCRFQIADKDDDDIEIYDELVIKFFDFPTGNGSVTPTISPCGRRLVAKAYVSSTQIMFRTWDMFEVDAYLNSLTLSVADKLSGVADISGMAIHEFVEDNLYSSDWPLQAVECNGSHIITFSSDGDVEDKRMGVFTLDGSERWIHDDFDVGKANAQSNGAGTHYELEGSFMVNHAGRDVLAVIIASGDSGARQQDIYYLDANRTVEGRSSSGRGSFHSTGSHDITVPNGEFFSVGKYDPETGQTTDILGFKNSGRSLHSGWFAVKFVDDSGNKSAFYGDGTRETMGKWSTIMGRSEISMELYNIDTTGLISSDNLGMEFYPIPGDYEGTTIAELDQALIDGDVVKNDTFLTPTRTAVLQMQTNNVTLGTGTIKLTAELRTSGGVTNFRIQENKNGAANGTMNVDKLSSGVSSLIISGRVNSL